MSAERKRGRGLGGRLRAGGRWILAWCMVSLAFAATASASFPGGNGKIVWDRHSNVAPGSQLGLFEMGPSGAGQRKLVGSGESLTASADGSKIAYESGGTIYVANADGSGANAIKTGARGPAFAPDGRIFYQDSDGFISSMDVNGNAVIPTGVTGSDPDVSPDGTRVVFVLNGPAGPDPTSAIYVMDASGAHLSKLSDAYDHDPSWSPDGTKIVFESQRLYAERVPQLFTMRADGGNQTLLTPTDVSSEPQYSPDGTRIVFSIEDDESDDQIATMPAAGGAITVLTSNPSGTTGVENRDPIWLPIPQDSPLQAEFFGFPIGEDQAALNLNIANLSEDGPLDSLGYPGGPAAGLIFNTNPYRPENRGALRLIDGPSPVLPASLPASSSDDAAYIVEVTKPGIVQVRSDVEGVDADGNAVSDSAAIEVVATDYDPNELQQQAAFAGAYVDLVYAAEAEADAAFVDMIREIEKALPKDYKREARRDKNADDPLAALYGLPPGTFNFLPDGAYNALLYVQASEKAEFQSWRDAFSEFRRADAHPLDYWMEHHEGYDPTTKYTTGQILWEMARSGKAAAGSFTDNTFKLVTTQVPALWEKGFDQSVLDAGASLARAAKDSFQVKKGEIKGIVKAIKQGDRKGILEMAEVTGKKRQKFSLNFLKTVLGEAAGGVIVDNALDLFKRMRKIGKAAKRIDAEVPDASTLEKLLARTIDDGFLPPSAKELGMPTADQEFIQQTIKKLEAKAAKQGYPGLKLEASFRPRSYSVPGAIGKNQFVPTKTGTTLDTLLGMHKSGIGENAIYKPKLPKNFSDLPETVQVAMKARYGEQLDTYRKWTSAKQGESNGLSELWKSTKAPRLFENKVNGVTTAAIKMEIGTVKKGETTLLRYQQLEVDGRRIVKGKATGAGTPIGSDYDGYLLNLVGGDKIPAGALNGIWMEMKDDFAKAAVERGFSASFHGVSGLGLDVGNDLFHSKVWQYVAESMPKDAAYKLFGYQGNEILDKMTFGQYLVKVTADGTGVGVFNP